VQAYTYLLRVNKELIKLLVNGMKQMKQLGIKESTYDELRKFRDENGLTSFTNAIQTLLNFRAEKDAEVNAYFTAKMGEFNTRLDKEMEKISDEFGLEALARKAAEKVLKERGITAKAKT